MSFEPQKFFIGLMSFFTILLPGALAAFLLSDWAPQIIGEYKYESLSAEAKWIIFFVASYLLGHFIFLLGASFLDEYVYDKIRAYPVRKQVKSLSKGKNLSPRWLRAVASKFVKGTSDEALFRAIEIKERYLAPINAASALNTFQWCKARLTSENPQALAVVQQFEADSKFFRSLVVVLVGWLAFAVDNLRLLDSLFLVLLIILALWRYIDQRLKSVTQAYWYIITMEAGAEANPKRHDAAQPTHAGGVIYRNREDLVEILLVQATNNADEWVLPKGHIEPEEIPQETAVREVREECNVWAKVKNDLGFIKFTLTRGNQTIVKIFLMEAVEVGKRKGKRQTIWLEGAHAIAKATHPETKAIIGNALEKLKETLVPQSEVSSIQK